MFQCHPRLQILKEYFMTQDPKRMPQLGAVSIIATTSVGMLHWLLGLGQRLEPQQPIVTRVDSVVATVAWRRRRCQSKLRCTMTAVM